MSTCPWCHPRPAAPAPAIEPPPDWCVACGGDHGYHYPRCPAPVPNPIPRKEAPMPYRPPPASGPERALNDLAEYHCVFVGDAPVATPIALFANERQAHEYAAALPDGRRRQILSFAVWASGYRAAP